MFEFATASAAAVGPTYSVLAKRNNWQWLGVFVVTPILLVLGLRSPCSTPRPAS